MENKMFCYQCQETAGCTGCKIVGVCGKTSDVAYLQDLLIYITKGISEILVRLREEGKEELREVDILVIENLFTTITNVNFNNEDLKDKIEKSLKVKENLLKRLENKEELSKAALISIKREEFLVKVEEAGILFEKDEDKRSLKEMIIYGLKGLAAYLKHGAVLKEIDDNINLFIEKALAEILKQDITVEELIALVLEVGKYGVAGMELLDRANTKNYGDPEITKVNIGVGKNPGILISGHDLKDLEMLLEQTQGTGVDVYTHSEMLPAHYYPKFKKYSNFIGNYGNAWWKQQEEFESFNGPIIMTTNCIVPPKESYKNRIFTTGLVSFEGCKHIDGEIKDFSEVIEMAKRSLPPKEIEKGEIIGGFAHNQVFQLADKIVEAIKNGDIKKFIVMGGCDGRSKKREYYTEFAKNLPKDTVILTAGCAKYRYNKLDLGMINGIPRVLDAGQCNDSYSLALIALKLKEVFNLDDINKLPIIYNISWYEQKAVIVLLSLLYLGVKNIHLGPTLPGFLSPNVAKVLVENFNIGSIGKVEEDLERFFD
ncbi:hydroxylamine reductase [uncultured Fusobacterium sp.]|uniref:hydroxylamine reductase n=1 Tax=uncultured Fusobacterium sp. TaxID=159267 RepID=UPI0028048697|nr:hydroxylamine reductase [uncultured Fusobacterium sp.]